MDTESFSIIKFVSICRRKKKKKLIQSGYLIKMIWIQIGKDNFIIVQINIKFKIEIWKEKKKKKTKLNMLQ